MSPVAEPFKISLLDRAELNLKLAEKRLAEAAVELEYAKAYLEFLVQRGEVKP